jgi:hypothetical protein
MKSSTRSVPGRIKEWVMGVWWNIRYYRLRKRFIRNVNHVAGTAQSPITIKMVDGQRHSVRTYDATAAIGYNQRKQWLDQVSKRDRELSAIREEYNSKNLN